ncbi:phytanoyl-CoA dioxygenase family protein [Paenibacillus sp.]|uniref:phytanoyl-CoA dioxygenase family protein n=1 Tax=Paenibacillus sp. TaxID=58172 RepID=UPI002D66DC83|nr:phytanoyl-CoA dioxygenase family protein [Paenibacillus sp.]HZG86265.1 phytanoyl-CoA dioxygenase family protein [Paenibacillus sp.]
MKLSYDQKKQLIDDGYVRIPGVVPPAMIRNALQAINHSIGSGMDTEKMPIYRAQSFCPELQQAPVIGDLFDRTPAIDLVASALDGRDSFRRGKGAQIALRFPMLQDPPPRPAPHLDGMYTPTNGVKEGTIASFTALVGILLSDLPETNAGNFTAWPGSHRQFEQYFREHGPEALLNGLPPVELPEPRQITGRAGDMILCHYLLGHGIAPNVSPNIRYAVFFRMTHVDHEWRKPMTDMWMHWGGVRDILQ